MTDLVLIKVRDESGETKLMDGSHHLTNHETVQVTNEIKDGSGHTPQTIGWFESHHKPQDESDPTQQKV